MPDLSNLINIAKKSYDKKQPNNTNGVNNLISIARKSASKYDDKLNRSVTDPFLSSQEYNPDYLPPNYSIDFGRLDTDELRAQKQSWVTKAARGINRINVELLANVAEIPGMLGSAIINIGSDNWLEDTVNNSWSQSLQSIKDWYNEEAAPVYMRKAVKEGNLWDNITSIDFWATEGASGIAFMASAMVPGFATKGLGNLLKLTNAIGKTQKGLKVLDKLDDVARIFGFGERGLKSGQSIGAMTDVLTATVANTMFEAGVEARGAMEQYQSIIDNKLAKGEITYEKWTELAKKKAEQGSKVFQDNLLLLSLPNFIMNKALLGRMIPKKQLGKFKVQDNKIISDLTEQTTKQQVKGFSSDLGKTIAKSFTLEGFLEEAGQMTFEKMRVENFLENNKKDWTETYLDVIGSTEGQKAIFLGGVLGSVALGIGDYRQRQANKKQREQLAKIMTESSGYFEMFADGILTTDENGNTTIKPEVAEKLGEFQDIYKTKEFIKGLLEQSAEAGNKSAQDQLELLEHTSTVEMMTAFAHAGEEGITLFENYLNNSAGLDSVLERINKGKENKLSKSDLVNEMVNESKEIKEDLDLFKAHADFMYDTPKDNEKAYNQFTNKILHKYTAANSNIRFIDNKISELNNSLDKAIEKHIKRYGSQLNEENKTKEYILNNSKSSILKNIKDRIKELEKTKQDNINELEKTESKEYLDKEYKNIRKKIEEREQNKKDEKDLDSLFDKINTITDFKELEKVKDSKLYNKYKSQLNKKIAERKMAINQIKKKEAEEANKKSKESKEDNDNKNLALEESIKYLKNNYEKGQPLNLNDEGLKALLEEYEAQAEANNMSIYDFKEIIYLGINEKTGQPDFKFVETGETFTVKPPVSTNTDTDEFTDLEGSDIDEEIDHNEKEGSDQEDIDKDKKKFKNKDKGYDHKVMSTDEDGNPISNIPQAFIDYQYSSEDKSDDIFTFEVNTNKESFKGAPKEIEMNQALDDFEAGKYTDTVLHYLPIKMKVNGSNEIYTFLDTPNLQGSDAHLNNYKNRTLRLRQSIIEVLKNGDSLEDYYVTIVGQAKGKLLMDKKGSLNKIREIQQLKNTPVTDIEVYYVNKLGQVISLDGDIANISNGDISNWKGSIFIKLKRPNGQDFFLKTNFRKINEAEADIIFDLNAFVLKGRKKGEDPAAYRLSDLPNDLKEKLKDFQTEIDLIKKITEIEPTVAELLNLLYFENSTSIKSRIMRSSKNNFVYGSTQNGGRNIDFTTLSEENYNKEKDRFKFWATKNKNRNVKVKDQRNETAPGINLGNKHYKEYMFDNLIFTDAITDATDGKPSFGGFANIYVSNTLSKKAKKTKATPKNPVPLTPTSNNGPGTNTFTNKSSNKSIEEQKAYIKRRRQEELTTLNVGDSYDVISSTGSFDGTWKVVEITDKFYRMTNEAGGKLNMLKSRVEENLKRPDGVTKTKYRKSNREEINARYDAEYVDAVGLPGLQRIQSAEIKPTEQSTTNKPVNKNNTMSIINNMLNDTKPETVTITNKEGVEESVYEKDGKIYERQSNYVTRNVKDFDSIRNDNMEAGATIGNLIDILARDIFGSKELLSQEEYIAITNRISDFDLGITKEAYDKLIDEITKVKDELTKKGFTFVSNDFFVYEEFSDEVKKQTGKDGVEGTLDLLVLDKKGNIHIVDFKSNKINNASELDIKTGDYFSNNFNNKVNNKVIKWSSQQSVYKNLTEKFGLTVKSINILPFASSYEEYDNKTMFINNVELMMPKVEKDKILRSPISDKLIKLEENNFILNKLNKDTEKSTKKVLSSQKKIVPLHEQNDTKKSKKEILADLKQQVKKGSRAYNAIQAMEKGAKFTPAMKKFFTQEQINIIKNCK